MKTQGVHRQGGYQLQVGSMAFSFDSFWYSWQRQVSNRSRRAVL